MADVDKKSRGFIFTWNNPDKTPAEFLNMAKKHGAKKCVFQLERGENGTPHYQGYLYYLNARFEKAISKHYGMWCQCAENDNAVQKYAQKERTKEDGPWGYGVKGFTVPEEVVETIEELREWQKEVDILTDYIPDKRSIHWFWEATGGVGKTEMAKYLCVRKNALYVQGKAADVKCALAKMKAEEQPMPKIVIFGFTRSNENFVSYEAIEAVKDGIFFSGKYESGMVIMNSPHVIVFANFPPELSKLSLDRWQIKEIK